MQADRPVPGPDDMESYLAAAVSDVSHREVVGPLLNGGGASGVVLRRGAVVASWGDPARTEMAFSATKSVLALVAGVAFDDGLLAVARAAKEAGFRVVGYYFQSRVEDCKRRNDQRPVAQQVPLAGILGTAGRMEIPTRAEGFDELFYVRVGDGHGFVIEEWKDEI